MSIKLKLVSSRIQLARITNIIFFLRGYRVILDSDLAEIYGVTTKRLNEAVKRNAARFPADFMFQISASEYSALSLQQTRHGGRRKLPWAFTEHGAIQAANVLTSERAIMMGVYVVRAFVQLRELIGSNKELAKRVDELEARLAKKLSVHDEAIVSILSAIRKLTSQPAHKPRPIGFTAEL